MIAKKKLLVIWFTGLVSGFTLMITGNTLNFWLAKEAIDIKTIGIFTLTSLPYAINFIWAPVLDTKNIPILEKIIGKRNSWIVLLQILLSLAVFILSYINPSDNLLLFALITLIISFFSSAQDTVLGAFRAELIDNKKQGHVSGIYIFGYRIGMLLSNSGAIYIAAYLDWNTVYKLFSLTIIFFPFIILLIVDKKEKASSQKEIVNNGLLLQSKSLKCILLEGFGSRNYFILIVLFLILYRLPDNLKNIMVNPFLLHIGYNEFEIAAAGKLFGTTATIIGGLIASHIMRYFLLLKSLIFFGSLHSLAHTFFLLQEVYGKDIYLLFFITGFESITGGMVMAAYIAYITSLCKGKFKATKYSFLSSIMGFSRSLFPAISGYIVSLSGWKFFYLLILVISFLSLVLAKILQKISIVKK